jgi:hypothetical protein
MAWFDDLVTRAEKGSPLTTTEADNIITTLRSAMPVTDSNIGKYVRVANDAFEYVYLIEDITYTTLRFNILNNLLIPGQLYNITDFATIYDQIETGTVKTGSTEPLVVLATSIDTLSPFAYSALFPNDIIKYDANIVATDALTAIKGRIIERIDEYGNRTDYDHRTVLFPRWETSTGSGIYTVLTDNGEDMNEYLTFGSNYPSVDIANNYLSNVYNTRVLLGQEWGNNVFQHTDTINNNCGGIFINNTFLGYTAQNTFSGSNENNVISAFFAQNTISGYFGFNAIQGAFDHIAIHGDFRYNTVVNQLRFTNVQGYINLKTMSTALYSLLCGNTNFAKEIFYTQNNKVFFSYFDGTVQVYTEIV